MLNQAIYINPFARWMTAKVGPERVRRMPRLLILTLEMMRQRTAFRNIRLYVHDPYRATPWWLYHYFQWLGERVMPGCFPIVMQPNVKYRKRLQREHPGIKFTSLRFPDNIRGHTSSLIAVLGADECAYRPRFLDNFRRAKQALLPMLNMSGTVAVFTGNADRKNRSFAQSYDNFRRQGADSAFWTFDALHPEAILPLLLTLLRPDKPKQPAPPWKIPESAKIPGDLKEVLKQALAAALRQVLPQATPTKIPA